ncbi:toxin CsE8 [Centruroides sculpturatus]|uniref:toxin CsE8 n=1 Tax=Centruroides sculpturatus TaxID=218467 RepID=UPI000C6DE721|nr:toxin CsE8 [Centruroides sculpturatus]XP_023213839.1 toxin CsE8 [Centruroides sculpturatus]
MNSLLMITACLVLFGTVWSKKGYLVHEDTGCRYKCTFSGENSYCDKECKSQGGDSGICQSKACYCQGLPEDTKTWPLIGKLCGRK